MYTIKVKKLKDNAVIPTYSRKGDAAVDLVASGNHIISAQATVAVGIGLAMELPVGMEFEVFPRSGISLKTPLRVANCVGTIDENYRGEVAVIMHNSAQQLFDYITEGETQLRVAVMCDFVYDLKGNKVLLSDLEKELGAKFSEGLITHPSFLIREGDKIAQGKLREVLPFQVEVVDGLTDTERGDGGFGSSGTSVKG